MSKQLKTIGYQGIVRFSEFSFNDVITELPDRYKNKKDLAKKAYDTYIKRGLKYNVVKGEVSTKDGWISKYNYDKPIYTHLGLYEILQDEFMPWINNSISRQLNGYSVI